MEDLILIGVLILMVVSAGLYANAATKLARTQARLKQEREVSSNLRTKVLRYRAEVNVLTLLSGIRTLGDDAIDSLEEEDLTFMDRENAIAHYLCALANWNNTLDLRDELLEELEDRRTGDLD